MEPSRKRKSLISKSMLSMSLYRATKPSSSKPAPLMNSENKPKPPAGFIIVNQDQVFPHQAPKVAYMAVTDRSRDTYGAKVGSFYGAEDEAVDAKAAKYISRLHDSFRLER